MSEKRFDISLPGLYKENWREAYRADKDDNPRLSSYQSPDGGPVPFIYKSLEFSGGQSVDTAEYPFFGLWSNESLNLKPQSITIRGYLRGVNYLKERAEFLAALLVPTSDDAPGFFDNPLWGRFKVVVESYNVAESANENGQCELTLTFKRAGVSLEARAAAASSAAAVSAANFAKPEEVALAASKEFAQTEKDSATLLRAFGAIKSMLAGNLGRIQAAQTVLNGVANEINGISNIITQGIQDPMQLAQALVNAVFSITGAAASIGDSIDTLKNYFILDSKKNTAMQFLSAADCQLPFDTVTARQAETKAEAENLYRTVSLCAAAEILTQMDDITLDKMNTYWALYTRLENSVNLENPDIFKAVTEMRSMLSQTLSQRAMSNELKKNIERPVPLLFLSHYLGCDGEKLRAMNLIEDALIVSGEVSYV